MNKYTTLRKCLMRDIHDIEDQRDSAMSALLNAYFPDLLPILERRGCERDKARDTVLRLRKQRAIARKFGEQMERERDEAREALREIASLDTSQDASPQQCGAVLVAMNALGL